MDLPLFSALLLRTSVEEDRFEGTQLNQGAQRDAFGTGPQMSP